jgi:dTDP-glucose pyrophosphorylase
VTNWREAVLRLRASTRDAIQNLSRTGLQIVLVLDDDDRLLGVLTDGDIRKALLAGQSLDSMIDVVMNREPRVAVVDETPAAMIKAMRDGGLMQLPVIDAGRVVGLVTLAELSTPRARENLVVIMAGGRGARLRPLTDVTPKPMLSVGGRPILETIVAQLVSQGFRDIAISINYLGESIRSHFGDGRNLGARINYIAEDTPLGTAGALSILQPRPENPIVVMNGDILTQLNFNMLLEFHDAHEADLTMVVREDEFRLPYGIVTMDKENIIAMVEKPVHRFHANAGIYVVNPEVLDDLRAGVRLDMTQLAEQLISRGATTVGFPLHEYWIDVGRSEQLRQAREEWGENS